LPEGTRVACVRVAEDEKKNGLVFTDCRKARAI
jgi:hypothetical protein